MTIRQFFVAGLLTGAFIGCLFLLESRLGDDLDPASPPHEAPVTVPTVAEAVPYNPCYSEDEVTVIVESDAYGWEAGHVLCVHRDFLREPK